MKDSGQWIFNGLKISFVLLPVNWMLNYPREEEESIIEMENGWIILIMLQSEVKWKAISFTLLLDEQFNELWSVEVEIGK